MNRSLWRVSDGEGVVVRWVGWSPENASWNGNGWGRGARGMLEQRRLDVDSMVRLVSLPDVVERYL